MSIPVDPAEYRRKHAAETRVRVAQLGPPIFVPSGDAYSTWRISGGGSERVESRPGEFEMRPTSVHVACHWRGRTLHVTTSLTAPPPNAARISMVLAHSVDDQSVLPLTLTVTERPTTMGIVEHEDVDLHVLECGDAWSAICEADGRYLWLEGMGVPIEGLQLRRIDDLDGVSESHWL